MAAKNAIEKDYYKLLNNSIYRKTCENIRKRVDVHLVSDKKTFLKMVSGPSYVKSKDFGNGLVAETSPAAKSEEKRMFSQPTILSKYF